MFSSAFGILGLETTGNGFATYFSEADRGREFKHQLQLKNPAGDDRWLELTLAPLRDRGDQLVGLRGLARDITERKQAELALRDSEERHRLLFESIPQPIWVYDEETLRFLTVNEAATRTYGFSRAEFLSLTVADMESPVTSQDGSGASRSGSSQHQTKHKQRIHVETTSHPVLFDGRNSRLVIVNDVSERNRLDQEQQRMHASLQQAAMEWRQTLDAV